VVRGSCARRAGLSIFVRGVCVRRIGWGSSRDTDERKSNDATECSELYKRVS
jgi:hypothetical protein